ncbi:unnamed protein product [Toxocara canis]|uniref:Cation_ATPase_N domain-containing protein n=1 Tax=Toxocara canis TaxID=6265 RepID=A0A183VDV4_TOXCA|nr:unnamed protein product [Toxocara canis]
MGVWSKKPKISVDELKKDIQMGHTTAKAMELLRKYGPNKLTPPPKTPAIIKLLRCLFGGFNILLWLGALASVASYLLEWKDAGSETKMDNLFLGIVLVVVVNITGVFAFYQEMSSSKIMESFAQMAPPSAKVSWTFLSVL